MHTHTSTHWLTFYSLLTHHILLLIVWLNNLWNNECTLLLDINMFNKYECLREVSTVYRITCSHHRMVVYVVKWQPYYGAKWFLWFHIPFSYNHFFSILLFFWRSISDEYDNTTQYLYAKTQSEYIIHIWTHHQPAFVCLPFFYIYLLN